MSVFVYIVEYNFLGLFIYNAVETYVNALRW